MNTFYTGYRSIRLMVYINRDFILITCALCLALIACAYLGLLFVDKPPVNSVIDWV